jgi:hypothetical protein
MFDCFFSRLAHRTSSGLPASPPPPLPPYCLSTHPTTSSTLSTTQAAHEVLQAHSGAKLYARLTSADFADNALALDHLAARVWPELAENEPAAVLTNVDVLLRALTAKACVPNCNPSVLMKVRDD